MSEPDAVDAPLLDALARRPLTVARTPDDRSVVVEHDGRRVVVACTDRALLAAWWHEHAADAPAVTVRELSLRELLGLWAAPDVDLLVDPDASGGVLVPVTPARRHLGLGPVVAEGDGSEPLPFTGFHSGRRPLQLLLVLAVVAVVLGAVALSRPDPWFGLAALGSLLVAGVIGRPVLRELRAARRATRRLQQARRLS
ncbi:hypothetical protein [Angustibacter sp. Root456]|uniref:hypothetical protein n=1 Tax=Angustibacter sp. Root456 TaxID=1736539 RepID=UPI0006F20B8E|nr:hypothetical protein [Angustibacter sp. Root456]KQX61933.1 hypothetical protein ASD06_15465 [Angustibacter sp. Root456]